MTWGVRCSMDLDELRTWYDRLRAELDGSRFELIWQPPIPNRPKQSACLSLDGTDRIGALTVWDSGEAHLQLAEVAGGEVTDEVLELRMPGSLRGL
ncbi:hypothetical protein AQJ23_15450 [Streptomyces antibioticus]|nr:hypothetical protein [Streptomyces antibioticus]KUN26553.1 hypothetical protein AQJ23_15450 [Streptomyces antibioticus]